MHIPRGSVMVIPYRAPRPDAKPAATFAKAVRAAPPSGPARQSGATLLTLLAALLVVGTSVMLTRLNEAAGGNRLEEAVTNSGVLAEAKAALIAYAITYPDNYPGEGPGFLPCPDVDNDGSPDPPCNDLEERIGRLPLRTTAPDKLAIGDLRDASGERLWYAVSNSFKNNPKLSPLNSETPGQLALDSQTDIVAVIIAPGAPLTDENAHTGGITTPIDQSTRESAPNDVTNYLEDINARIQSVTVGGQVWENGFVTRDPENDAFNDQIIVITRAELMTAVERRVLGEVASVLERYRETYGMDSHPPPPNGDGVGDTYPWLSPFADPGTPVLTGNADAGSTGSTLVDTDGAFIARGVREGDVIVNTSNGSLGVVIAVDATSLSVDAVLAHVSDAFAPGDDYRVARFNGAIGAQEGLLPFHVPDEPFKTGLGVDWDLRAANGAEVEVEGGGLDTYRASIERFAESSALFGRVEVGVDGGVCVWKGEDAVECAARVLVDYFEGTATRQANDALEHTGRHFEDWAVVSGAVVENLSDPLDPLDPDVVASAIVGSVDDDELVLATPLQGGAKNRFDVGDSYRVRVPTSSTPADASAFQADAGSAGDTLVDDDENFVALGIRPGDTIYNQSTDEWGRIATVDSGSLTASGATFDEGDVYHIRYKFVDQREYEFMLVFEGQSPGFYRSSIGEKRRDVCSNVLGGCAVIEPFDDGQKITISLRDYDAADNVVGCATSTNGSLPEEQDVCAPGPWTPRALMDPPEPPPSGMVLATGIYGDLDVQESDSDTTFDLPMWFTEHEWHRLVYVAAAGELVPGKNGTCGIGTDCLTLNGATPDDDKRVLVVMAGAPLATQNRSNASTCGPPESPFLCDYFEGENASYEGAGPPPLTFVQGPASATFNDQIRVVATEEP